MIQRKWWAESALFVACLLVVRIVAAADSEEGASPTVVLSWDESGDFGPDTPGTKTAGWQEAIDHCVAHGRDLYVKGGWGGRKAIYHVQETIRIPATQDFRIDGGVYVLNWTGPPDGPGKDLMVIDSTMNAEYHFGIFVYGGAGAALRIRPENPVPIDGFPVFVETEIKSQGIADPQPFTPGEREAGSGLVLDGRKAPIVCSRFDFIGGILNFKTCVEVTGTFVQNHFQCLHLHTNADHSTLFVLGPDCSQNVVRLTIGVDMGAQNVRGIAIAGKNNTLEVTTRGGFPPGNHVILQDSAGGNRVDFIHGRREFDPSVYITDEALEPTNQITWVGGSIPARTLHTTPGTFLYTQRLYPACARLARGTDATVQLIRGEARIACSGDSAIFMDVGDALSVESGQPQEICVIPLKPR